MERPTKEQVDWALADADRGGGYDGTNHWDRVLTAEVRALRDDLRTALDAGEAAEQRIVELKKELQDFEADQSCEERCERLEAENARLREELADARKDRDHADACSGRDIEALAIVRSQLESLRAKLARAEALQADTHMAGEWYVSMSDLRDAMRDDGEAKVLVDPEVQLRELREAAIEYMDAHEEGVMETYEAARKLREVVERTSSDKPSRVHQGGAAGDRASDCDGGAVQPPVTAYTHADVKVLVTRTEELLCRCEEARDTEPGAEDWDDLVTAEEGARDALKPFEVRR